MNPFKNIEALSNITKYFSTLQQARDFAKISSESFDAVSKYSAPFWHRMANQKGLLETVRMRWSTGFNTISRIMKYKNIPLPNDGLLAEAEFDSLMRFPKVIEEGKSTLDVPLDTKLIWLGKRNTSDYERIKRTMEQLDPDEVRYDKLFILMAQVFSLDCYVVLWPFPSLFASNVSPKYLLEMKLPKNFFIALIGHTWCMDFDEFKSYLPVFEANRHVYCSRVDAALLCRGVELNSTNICYSIGHALSLEKKPYCTDLVAKIEYVTGMSLRHLVGYRSLSGEACWDFEDVIKASYSESDYKYIMEVAKL